MTTATQVALRPYQDSDEPAVLELLRASLGQGPAGARTAGFFRWKHVEAHHGRSHMLVAEDEGRIVGFRAFMRWEFYCGERRVRAVRAVDTATHPAHQGRGIFTALTRAALAELASEADFVFNTPNSNSLPGYLKMGWQQVGPLPALVRPLRPLRAAVRARAGKPATPVSPAAPTAAEILASVDLSSLIPDGGQLRYHTPVTPDYLAWRYAAAPLDYRALLLDERGRPRGVAFFRVRARGRLAETTLCDLLVRPGDLRSARRLLRRVAAAAPSDHVAAILPPGSTARRAALSLGWVPVRGNLLVVNRLGRDHNPDPLATRSWALATGDVEVF